MWIMDVSGDALFPRRYLDEYEKRVFELHRCVERAREHNADAMRQAAGFLLDAADAHEQAAMAYELAGGNGHARAFQARAMRHRQAAAARRAAAAALASGVPKGRVSDDPRPHAAIPDGDPPGLPGEPDAGTDHLGVSCGNGHEQQRDTRFCELPRDITYRAVGPAQAVLLLAVLLLAADRRSLPAGFRDHLIQQEERTVRALVGQYRVECLKPLAGLGRIKIFQHGDPPHRQGCGTAIVSPPAIILCLARIRHLQLGINAVSGSGIAMWSGASGPLPCESGCMRKYVIMGIQGSGKGTHAKMLAADFDLEHIAVGDIFRWNVQHHTKLGAQVRRTMAAGLLVGDDLVEGVVGVRLREHDWNYGFIIDGFPRNERQAEFFLESYDLDGVIHLDLPDSEVARRVLARRLCANCGMDYSLIDNSPATEGRCDACGGELIQREDDTEEALAVRLREYHAKTNPVLDIFRRKEYVTTVDTRPPREEVQQAIRDRLGLPSSRLAVTSSQVGAR